MKKGVRISALMTQLFVSLSLIRQKSQHLKKHYFRIWRSPSAQITVATYILKDLYFANGFHMPSILLNPSMFILCLRRTGGGDFSLSFY